MCRLLVCFSFFQFIAAHHLFAPLPEMFNIKPVMIRCISEIAERCSSALSGALPTIGFLDPVAPLDTLPKAKILPAIEQPFVPRRRRFESCPDTATTSALLLHPSLTFRHHESFHPAQPPKGASENDTLLLSVQPTTKKPGFISTSLMIACSSARFCLFTKAPPALAKTELPPDSPSPTPQPLQRRSSILSESFEESISLHDCWDETSPNINDATNAPELKIKGLLSSIQNSKVYQKLLTKELEATAAQTIQITQPQIQKTALHNEAHTVVSTCNIDKNPSFLLTIEVAETIPFTSGVVMKNASITHDKTTATAPNAQLSNHSSNLETADCPFYATQSAKALFNQVLSELKERAAKEPCELHTPKHCFDLPSITKHSDILQAFFCALRHAIPTTYTIESHSRMVRLSTQKQPSGKPSVRKHRPAFSQVDDTIPFRVSAQSKHVAHRLTPKKIPYAFYSGLPLLLTKNQTFIPFYQSKRFQTQNEELIEEKVLQRQHAHTKNSTPSKPSKPDKTVNQMSHLQKEPDDQDKIPQEKPQALHPFRNERSQEINCWIKRIALSTTFITLGAFLITLLKLSLF